MKVEDYLTRHPAEWKNILTSIHNVIIKNDKTINVVVEPMMKIEMIIYKDRGMMKYGLSGTKNYMSLHVLPIYGSAALHKKYKDLLNKANFQKGCINFTNEDQMPVSIVKDLIKECAAIDLIKMREEYLLSRKAKGKK